VLPSAESHDSRLSSWAP